MQQEISANPLPQHGREYGFYNKRTVGIYIKYKISGTIRIIMITNCTGLIWLFPFLKPDLEGLELQN